MWSRLLQSLSCPFASLSLSLWALDRPVTALLLLGFGVGVKGLEDHGAHTFCDIVLSWTLQSRSVRNSSLSLKMGLFLSSNDFSW